MPSCRAGGHKLLLLVIVLRIQFIPFPKSRPISPTTKTTGDRWVKERRSAVLQVPGIVVPEEYNYLLNPNQPDFVKIEIGQPAVYYFDPRLGTLARAGSPI